MTMQGDKTLNKNFLIAAGVLLVIGLAVAVGVTLSSEPLTAGLPEGETTVTGEVLPVYALSLIHISEPTRQAEI